jgi:digeranylgeranylglycerophospholipid reductase
MDTLLIEKRQQIGEPVRCAEGVPHEGLIEFVDIDRKWVCADIFKARLYAPNPENTLRLSQLPGEHAAGHILDRKLFDVALARSAADAGADVVTKTQATSLLWEEGHVVGIHGKCRGEDLDVRAKIVIGADGVESKVGRWAGITSALSLKDIETCAQFHLTNIDMETDCCDFYFGNQVAPGGYAWVFPKGDHEANVGLGMIGSRVRDMHPEEYLQAFIAKKFQNSKVMASIVGAVPVCNMPKRISGDGIMLVGDSAHLVDPLMGAGIINAMRSGRIAAGIAAKAISGGDVSARALHEYDREIQASIGKTLSRNYRLKEIYRRASDPQIGILLKAIKSMNAEHRSIAKIFKVISSSDGNYTGLLKALL